MARTRPILCSYKPVRVKSASPGVHNRCRCGEQKLKESKQCGGCQKAFEAASDAQTQSSILKFMASGLDRAQIASALHASVNLVRLYVRRLKARLNAKTDFQLAFNASNAGLI